MKSGKDKRRIAKHNGRENRRYIHRVLAVVTKIHLFSKIENEKIDSVVFFSGAIEIIWSNLPNIQGGQLPPLLDRDNETFEDGWNVD